MTKNEVLDMVASIKEKLETSDPDNLPRMVLQALWEDVFDYMCEHPEEVNHIEESCPYCGAPMISSYFVSPPSSLDDYVWNRGTYENLS